MPPSTANKTTNTTRQRQRQKSSGENSPQENNRRLTDILKPVDTLVWMVKLLSIVAIFQTYYIWTTNDEYKKYLETQNSSLNSIVKQMATQENELFSNNIMAFSVNSFGAECKLCHLNRHNLLDLKQKNWTLTEFQDFVKGKDRSKNPIAENYMPHFEKATNMELEAMFRLLKGK